MSQELLGPWYVYRYNISRHVLKAPETELTIKELGDSEKEDCRASFELSGWDKPVEVEMTFDPRTEAWHGDYESIDFRWERVENSGAVMLVGHASDRSHIAHRDFFLAVRSRRTAELPWPPPNPRQTYQFGPSYESYLERKKRVQPGGGISVTVESVAEEKIAGEIKFNGTKYFLESAKSFEQGIKVFGSNDDGGLSKLIWLWLLPLDETGRMLATGYYYGIHDYGLERQDTTPGLPGCTNGTHGG